jgi:NADH-quinone oxidoreductase subunit G
VPPPGPGSLAYGPGESRFVEIKRTFEKPIPISDLVLLDRERCVLCARCTRFSEEISGDPLIEFMERGNHTEVNTFPDLPFSSYFSGNTVQICPVGALTAKPYRFGRDPGTWSEVESSSLFDTAHPRIEVHASQNEILRFVGVDNDATNHGWLSDKDRFGFEHLDVPERLTTPLIRRDGELIPVGWHEALEIVANRLDLIREEDGGDALAVIGGAQGTNEDAYALAKFARVVLGTHNIDCRLDDALSSHFLAATVDRAVIDDLDRADTILVWGPDLKEEHPTLYLRVRRAVQDFGATLVVVHPRATGLDDRATVKLEYRPGGGFDLLDAIADGSHPEAGQALAARSGGGPGRGGQSRRRSPPPRVGGRPGPTEGWVVSHPPSQLTSQHLWGPGHGRGTRPPPRPGCGGLDRMRRAGRRLGRSAATTGQGHPGHPRGSRVRRGAGAAAGRCRPGPGPPRPGGGGRRARSRRVLDLHRHLHPRLESPRRCHPSCRHLHREGWDGDQCRRPGAAAQPVASPPQDSARPDWAILEDLATVAGTSLGLASAETITKEIAEVAPAYTGVSWDLLDWDHRDGVVVPMSGSQPLITSRSP